MESKVARVCITVVIVSLIALPVGCTINTNNNIAAAVARGADPIAVRCAMENTSDSRSSSVCIVKALEGSKK